MGRPGKYLYKRTASPFWWLRLQYPGSLANLNGGKKKREVNLRVTEQREAEIKAWPIILEHKKLLIMTQQAKLALKLGYSKEEFRSLVATARPQYEPFKTLSNGDGTTTFATDEMVYVNGPDGETIRRFPNETILGIKPLFMTPAERAELGAMNKQAERVLKKPVQDVDVDIMETYYTHAALNDVQKGQAKAVFEDFKRVCGGKRFADCDRSDGRKLATFYISMGNKSATVRRKLGYLSAAINVEAENRNPRVRFNPFLKVVPKLHDKVRRTPLYNEDLEKLDANLHKMGQNERRLYLIARHTGCRRSEAWQIEETREKGLRIIWFGSKNEQSVRRIPLPDALVPHLPERIEGSLFSDNPKNVGRNLLRAMRRFGIYDATKVIHSFRHRAKDRLRAERCHRDMQEAILGHEERTVAASYGHGFPMTLLKPHVERIGQYDEPDFVPDPTAYDKVDRNAEE